VNGHPFQHAPEAIIVELLGRDAVVVRKAGLLGPLADAIHGLGFQQSVGDQDLGQGADRDIPFPGDGLVKSVGQVESLEVLCDDG
jgi:hypothetical protein